LIKAKWKETETGRQAKFYSLTAAGSAQLEREAANWSRLSEAMNLVVVTT
jgi:DNA-binding PadR family transcriptional regulator